MMTVFISGIWCPQNADAPNFLNGLNDYPKTLAIYAQGY